MHGLAERDKYEIMWHTEIFVPSQKEVNDNVSTTIKSHSFMSAIEKIAVPTVPVQKHCNVEP